MIADVNESSLYVQLSLLHLVPDHGNRGGAIATAISGRRSPPLSPQLPSPNSANGASGGNLSVTDPTHLADITEDAAHDRILAGLRLCGERYHGAERQRFACAVTHQALLSYWAGLMQEYRLDWPLAPLAVEDLSAIDDDVATSLAVNAGLALAAIDPVTAGYRLGQIYTTSLPPAYRARFGIYFTPPSLSARLLSLASEAGVDWGACRVLDPACGGGAFLAPVALKVASMLEHLTPAAILAHIETHVHGYEVDPFGAWMSQVLVEAALLPLCAAAKLRLRPLVAVCDSLMLAADKGNYDLVIGNPPYGRVTLAPAQRQRYARSVYGHANLYGLFMDLAVRWTRPDGYIAFVTPTSFLGGEYFKALRKLMAAEAPPVAIDLVASRKDLFTDVLQETLLATYARGALPSPARVHVVAGDAAVVTATPTGTFVLPANPAAPWFIPRRSDQVALIESISRLPCRLRDYGYKVSTGPLVWNRHKDQLRTAYEPGAAPIVWAESVTMDGVFVYRAAKKNHQPYLLPDPGDEWLLTRHGCVLVQRTTAKEQRRRLLAAEMPTWFVEQHGAVSVENHLNMVRPTSAAPTASACVIAALLNSAVVDDIFRCINGSVAVSAAELEAIPLPQPGELAGLERLLRDAAAHPGEIEDEIRRLYYDRAVEVFV